MNKPDESVSNIESLPWEIGNAWVTLTRKGENTASVTGALFSTIKIGEQFSILIENDRGVTNQKTRPISQITDNGDGSFTIQAGSPTDEKPQSMYIIRLVDKPTEPTAVDDQRNSTGSAIRNIDPISS